jgi:hypothetical protein
MEQLGWMVDLEEGPREVVAALELDERPVAKKLARPAAEMEAEIPSMQLPAAFEAARSPALAPPTPPVVVAPVVVRVQPAVARAPVIGATDIAKFRGHVEVFQPTTFLALLGASPG